MYFCLYLPKAKLKIKKITQMKKSLLLLLTGSFFMFTACKSELDLDKELKFSKLTVEEQKQKVEDSGIEFVNAMNGMQDTKAMIAIGEFLSLTNGSAAYAPLKRLKSDLVNRNAKVFTNFDRQLRVAAVESSLWGEWEWNSTYGELELINELENKAIIRFPASSTSTTNNGLITITYTESSVEVPETGEMFPSEITFVMKVDNKEVMSADYNGTYYADGSPKEVTQKFDLDTYNWTAKISNNQKKASESYEFKKGSTTLLKSEAAVEGNLKVDNIQTAGENGTPENIINSFALYFQVSNIAVKGGTTDFKGLVTAIKAIDEDQTEKEYYNALAQTINKYMVTYAFFVDDNRKFADVEYYVVEDVYEDYQYNNTTYQFELVTITNYYLQPRMIMSDGSKVDVEEYVQNGFEDLLDQIEALANDYDY